MNAKLTLSIDEMVIRGVKEYAYSQGKSVSEIVEKGLAALIGVKLVKKSKPTYTPIEISPFIKNFHAGIGKIDIPADFDYKKAMAEILTEKYASL